MKTFLIAEDFQSHLLVVLVIVASEHLTEAAFTDLFLNLEAVSNMVFGISDVLILFIVEAVVVLGR